MKLLFNPYLLLFLSLPLPTLEMVVSNETFANHNNSEEKYSEMTNVDHFFLTVLGIIVFFMQCGFGFLEAGAVRSDMFYYQFHFTTIHPFRSKNTVNILIKNWLDMCLGAIVYWALGFGLTWGEDVAGIRFSMTVTLPRMSSSMFIILAEAPTLSASQCRPPCSQSSSSSSPSRPQPRPW